MDSLCRVRNKIVYVLSWGTVSVLTQVFSWCLFPELRSTSGNKHQKNPLVSAETVRHSSTYIILYSFRSLTCLLWRGSRRAAQWGCCDGAGSPPWASCPPPPATPKSCCGSRANSSASWRPEIAWKARQIWNNFLFILLNCSPYISLQWCHMSTMVS